MISHNLPLSLRDHSALPLIAGNDDLNGLFQILLNYSIPAAAYRPECRFVDDVGKLCTGCAGGRPSHCVKVDAVRHFHIFCVDF